MKRWILAGIAYIAYAAIVATFVLPNVHSEPRTSRVLNETPKVVQTTTQDTKPTVDELHALVNAERVKAGLAPLKLDAQLNQSAQLKVNELVAEGWDETPHVSDSGIRGITYIDKQAVECVYRSENLLVDAYSSQDGLNAWLNSPAHRTALLDPRYELVGYAVSNGYVAQHFCDLG